MQGGNRAQMLEPPAGANHKLVLAPVTPVQKNGQPMGTFPKSSIPHLCEDAAQQILSHDGVQGQPLVVDLDRTCPTAAPRLTLAAILEGVPAREVFMAPWSCSLPERRPW